MTNVLDSKWKRMIHDKTNENPEKIEKYGLLKFILSYF